MKLRSRMPFVWIVLLSTLLISGTVKGNTLATLADTPWPMYQHDPQHTGRSPFLGPQHSLQLLWTKQIVEMDPYWNPLSGGISIAPDGTFMISAAGRLLHFDPISRSVLWVSPLSNGAGGQSTSTVLIGSGGEAYWHFLNSLARVNAAGQTEWVGAFDNNYAAYSGPVFGPDGNIYLVHDTLWSIKPDGKMNWYFPYDDPFVVTSPAVGLDNRLYAPGQETGSPSICAFSFQTGQPEWCFASPYLNGPSIAIGSDGSVYAAGQGILKINSSGKLLWSRPVPIDGYIPNVVVSRDDSAYFYVRSPSDPMETLNKVDANGILLWQISFPHNDLTGGYANLVNNLTLDRDGNVYFCAENSRCYGVSSAGQILWEYEFPLVDSIVLAAGVQPLLAADGLLFVIDNHYVLYALADPAVYPILTTNNDNLQYSVTPGSADINGQVAVSSSTGSAVSFSVSAPAAGWLSISSLKGAIPGAIGLTLKPKDLPPGVYETQLKITPDGQVGNDLLVRVKMTVENPSYKTYLPMVPDGPGAFNEILFLSDWFKDRQLAAISPNGENRRVIVRNLPPVNDTFYSPDGQKAALVYMADYNSRPQLMVLDTASGKQLLNISGGDIAHVSWSPDNQRFAYVATSGTSCDLFIRKINENAPVKLAHLDIDYRMRERDIQWSPKGDKIAVDLGNITIFNLDGSVDRTISSEGNFMYMGPWSPDGNYLLFYKVVGADYIRTLWKYELRTGFKTSLITDRTTDQAAWSPDGKRIAGVTYSNEALAREQLFLIDRDSRNFTILNNDGYDGFKLMWSPDGKWLVFSCRKSLINDDPNFNIFIESVDGKIFRQLTTNLKGDTNPYWH